MDYYVNNYHHRHNNEEQTFKRRMRILKEGLNRMVIEFGAEILALIITTSQTITNEDVFLIQDYGAVFFAELISASFYPKLNIYQRIAIAVAFDQILESYFEYLVGQTDEFIIDEKQMVEDILLAIIVFHAINAQLDEEEKSYNLSTFLLVLYAKTINFEETV